jgi:uncharacterized protein (TIGR00369 family)
MLEKISSPFENLIGMEIIEKSQGKSIISIRKKDELTNFLGIIHGGVLASICDTAAVQALMTLAPEGPYLTAELAIKYKKPAQSNEIFAHASAKHVKSKFFQTHIEIVDGNKALISTSTVKSLLPNYRPTNL